MLKLTVIWQDDDLIECDVTVQSAAFRAAAHLYFTAETLRDLASAVAGFPKTIHDTRQFETENSELGSRMSIDIGPTVFVKIYDNENTSQYAGVRFSAEAAAFDRFERELGHLAANRAGTAVLESAL